jgi:mannose-6-phosphate isomerase-like protein (cupin superfamily)
MFSTINQHWRDTMYVIDQARPQPTSIPGVAHATWAGSADGLQQLSVWRQTVAPGGATPPHSHDCDELVLCQSGWGEVHIGGQAHRFGPDSTIVLPKGLQHQIFNTGAAPMEIVGVFGGTPVGTFLPDGSALALPWRT